MFFFGRKRNKSYCQCVKWILCVCLVNIYKEDDFYHAIRGLKNAFSRKISIKCKCLISLECRRKSSRSIHIYWNLFHKIIIFFIFNWPKFSILSKYWWTIKIFDFSHFCYIYCAIGWENCENVLKSE